MFKSLKKLIKPALVIGAGFVANKFGGPIASKFAKKAVGSLMGDGSGSGGNFQLADTSVSPQSYGGRVGFERSDSAGNVNKIKTADGKQLSEEWEYRLNKWYKNKDTRYT